MNKNEKNWFVVCVSIVCLCIVNVSSIVSEQCDLCSERVFIWWHTNRISQQTNLLSSQVCAIAKYTKHILNVI